jgi:small GTP-binding protein
MSNDNKTEKEFNETFEKAYKEKIPNFDEHVNIAILGKVSSGKSSLLNAILECDRTNPVAKVGAEAGVTKGIDHHKFGIASHQLDDHVLIIDSPGLDDVRKENSAQTRDFLKSIDIGILVLEHSLDLTQKKIYDDLKSHAKKTIVVLNKIDEWDKYDETALTKVLQQWMTGLGVEKIFCACTNGYDPDQREGIGMDLRGVDEIRKEIVNFLEKEGKALLFEKVLRNKENAAIKIIATAVICAAAEAWIPGSAAWITATQAVAITSLAYLYTGEYLSKSSVLGLLPTFAGESIGTTLFLWAKSFLPPTVVVDVVASGIAASITFAMLAAVNYVLQSGKSLQNVEIVKEAFVKYLSAGNVLKNISASDLKSADFLTKIVKDTLTKI